MMLIEVPELRETVIRETACPRCDAQPGERCDGKPGADGCHQERWQVYLS